MSSQFAVPRNKDGFLRHCNSYSTRFVGRSTEREILDDSSIPESVRARCYEELDFAHRCLGNSDAVLDCIRRDPLPVRSVLDIGCGFGRLLRQIQTELGIDGIGVDLTPPSCPIVPILKRDAVHESLPAADVAIAMAMAHHLTDPELVQLIHNVGRSSRRLIILDLIRHPLPAFLFRSFVAPFVHRITAFDGIRSFERAFTVEELKATVADALIQTGGSFQHTVGPLRVRQVADISFVR
jgi:SAM-dependent methyltransferase